MSKDILTKVRKKNKFIFEIKYQGMTKLIDNRGKIITELTEEFKNKVSHWRLNNLKIEVLDDLNDPLRILNVDHLSSRLMYEDAGSIEEFKNDSKKFIKKLYNFFYGDLNKISRIGIRFNCIYSNDGFASYEDVQTKINEIFLNPQFSLSIKPSDISIKLAHSNGFFVIIPFSKEDPLIDTPFQSESNIPAYGLFLDIDSYATDIECPTPEKLYDAFLKVANVTIELEKEILGKFGL